MKVLFFSELINAVLQSISHVVHVISLFGRPNILNALNVLSSVEYKLGQSLQEVFKIWRSVS